MKLRLLEVLILEVMWLYKYILVKNLFFFFVVIVKLCIGVILSVKKIFRILIRFYFK